MYEDVVLKISEFLTSGEKIRWSATSITMNKLKYKFTYDEFTRSHEIIHLPFYDNFESIILSNIGHVPPKNVKQISFCANTNEVPLFVTHLFFSYPFEYGQPIKKLPHSVTYLYFGCYFNQPIDNCIPSSVTHLEFGKEFNQSIKNNIPLSVTHLTFDNYFDKLIKDHIPSSVTHLTLGYYFNHSIKNIVPPSVTYLELSCRFDQEIDVPLSVKEITINNRYNKSISDEMSSRVKIIRRQR